MPRDLLAEVNALEIAKEELWEIASDLSASDRESPDAEPCFEAGFTTIARRTKKRRRRRAFAIWSRMEALARLVEDEGAPGWTLPQMPDGSIPPTVRYSMRQPFIRWWSVTASGSLIERVFSTGFLNWPSRRQRHEPRSRRAPIR